MPFRAKTAEVGPNARAADARTQANIRNTAWAGYQAIAEYVDHFAPVRTRQDKATARAARVLTTTEPTRIKTRAWALATA